MVDRPIFCSVPSCYSGCVLNNKYTNIIIKVHKYKNSRIKLKDEVGMAGS